MTAMTDKPAAYRKYYSSVLAATAFSLSGSAMQVVRRGNGQGVMGPGVRRAASGILSAASEPDNLLITAAIAVALVVLIVLIVLTVREFLLWRRGQKK
jgi:hypothetical protein